MARHWQYLKYITRHKWYVFLAARTLGVPLLGIVHDWSKFKPSEWKPYARTFYNKDGSKRYKEHPEFTTAWLHHQKRNKHHWQYWMITWDRGETECLPMPDRYRREMFADWIGAGRALGKPYIWDWYMGQYEQIQLHSETREWVDSEMIEFALENVPVTVAALIGWTNTLETVPLNGFPLDIYEAVVLHLKLALGK